MVPISVLAHGLMWCTQYERRWAWWRHQMETFSALLALCAGNSPITGEFPTERPVMRSFDVFFDLRLNKRLSKQRRGWWFETSLWSLWRHCNGMKWKYQATSRLNYIARFSVYEVLVLSRVTITSEMTENPNSDILFIRRIMHRYQLIIKDQLTLLPVYDEVLSQCTSVQYPRALSVGHRQPCLRVDSEPYKTRGHFLPMC